MNRVFIKKRFFNLTSETCDKYAYLGFISSFVSFGVYAKYLFGVLRNQFQTKLPTRVNQKKILL